MKVSQLGWIVSAFVLAAMIGCGNSGDPGKDHAGLKQDATVKANPGVPTPVPQPPPALPPVEQHPQWNCTTPMKITVEKDGGNKALVFTEDTESTYTINVNSLAGSDFKVDTTDLTPSLSADMHAGRAKFNTVKVEGAKGTYTFTWKPGKLANGQKSLMPLTLNFASPCGDKNTDSLNLIVNAQKTGVAK